jgi:hypothetical protein
MQEFLATVLSYPTVLFTVLLGVALVYWMLVIFGAVGVDVLDLDVDVDADAEVDVDGATEGLGIISTLFHVLKLRNAPMTLVLSLLVFWSWVLSYLGVRLVLPLLGMDGPLGGTVVLVLGAVAALPITSLMIRPLGSMLKVEPQTSRSDLVGKIVRIDTNRVDARSGTARFDEAGTELMLQVRCDGDNTLRRGDKALVLSYDEGRHAYEVTPFDELRS